MLIDEKVVFSWVPSASTVAMMATEIPAAKIAYSIAVAPEQSAMNFRSRVVMLGSMDAVTMMVELVRSAGRQSPSN